MKWVALVAALVALLVLESFSLPTPKDKKAKKEKHINERDKNEKVVDPDDNDEKDEAVKDADEKDVNVKDTIEKDEDVKDADVKDEEVKDVDDNDEDGKDADEKDEDGNEKKTKNPVKTAKKKKATRIKTKVKDEKDKKKTTDEGSADDTEKNDLGNTKVEETTKKKNSKKDLNKVKTEVTVDIKETKKTITKDKKTEETEETIVDEKQENNDTNAAEYKEGISEEEVYMDDDDKDELGAEAVKGNEKNLIEDMNEDLYLPISGRLKSAMLPESDRVMDEPDFLPRAEAVMDDPLEGSMKQRAEESQSLMPTAERVMMAQETGTKPGGDGKMKMNLNLKDLDGNPSDLTVGAAAVGLMSQAVKSKGPDDNQVNAVAGFGHQIMGLVSELEKDSK